MQVRDGTRFHTLERFVSAAAAEQAGADIMHLVAELQWGRKHVPLPRLCGGAARGCGGFGGDGRPPLEASPLSMHLKAHAPDGFELHVCSRPRALVFRAAIYVLLRMISWPWVALFFCSAFWHCGDTARAAATAFAHELIAVRSACFAPPSRAAAVLRGATATAAALQCLR